MELNRWHIYAALKIGDTKRFLTMKQLEEADPNEVKEGLIEYLKGVNHE